MYEFGEFRIDPRRRVLLHGRDPVALTSKAFETLLVLVERRERVVSKDELMKLLWPHTVVEEANLSQNVFMVRKALGERAQDPRFIVTVQGNGYRFVGPVRESADCDDDSGLSSGGKPQPERWPKLAATALLALAAAVCVAWVLVREPSAAPGSGLAPVDTLVIADLDNRTGEAIFDGFLRQALTIELEQSPFLRILPEERLAKTLLLMERRSGEPRTRALVLEVCQRESLKAALVPTLTRVSRKYLLSVEAIACGSGARIASTQSNANDPDGVLDALDDVGKTLRQRLGESLASIEKFDRPLRAATTSSLEALRTFTMGADIMRLGPDESAAIPVLERALALDPQFALAHAYLAVVYSHLGESARAAGEITRAYALRNRTSERERLLIVSMYHWMATGDLDQEVATYNLWRAEFPHDWIPLQSLSNIRGSILGDFEREAELALEAARLDPKQSYSVAGLSSAYLAMNRIDEARAVLERAITDGLDGVGIRAQLYRVAVMQGDTALAQAQRQWSKGQPVQDNLDGALNSDLLRQGRFQLAHTETTSQVRSLVEQGFRESAATTVAWLALSQAEFGEHADAKSSAAWSLSLARGRDSLPIVALSLAMAGDEPGAIGVIAEIQRDHPYAMAARRVYIPLAEAALALERNQPQEAVSLLEPLRRYDLGYEWSYLPPYLRGLALLRAQRGAEAADQFRKIVESRGVSPLSPEWMLANLGLARAHALAGDLAASRDAYERTLALWKDADGSVVRIREVRAEARRLQASAANRELPRPP